MLQNVLSFVNTLILLIILGFLKDAPKFIRELKVEKLKSENQSNLQVESYFREISGKDLQETFRKWLTLIEDMNAGTIKEKKLEDYVKDLQTKTFMYGSSTTIGINSCMMQLLYENNSFEKQVNVSFGKEKEKETDYRVVVYTAYMIASLKRDFTGYEIRPTEYLEVKISDYKRNKTAFEKAEKQVKEALSKKGIKL